MTAKDDRLWDNLDSDDRPWLALASEREQKEDLGWEDAGDGGDCEGEADGADGDARVDDCLLYTSPSPRD